MTEAAIPFANLQSSGYDELGGASPAAFNIIVDGAGVVRKRPGIHANAAADSSILESGGLTGIYVALDGTIFAIGSAPGERAIYRVNSGGGVALGGGVAPYGVRGTTRPIFAETEMLVVVACSREVEKIIKASLTTDRLGGSPPLASHVISLSNRLLANDTFADKTKVRFSDVALGTTDYSGHEVWSLGGVGTSGYFTAEARSDNVVALADSNGEAWIFGQTTLQTFGPNADVASPFVPVSSIELGCGAPYSLIKEDDSYHWLDQKRRLVKSSGRGYTIESDAIQTTLDAMGTTNDAYGFNIRDGFLNALCWVFPTDGRTFVFQKDIGWGQWAGWANGDFAPLIVGGTSASPIDGTTFVATTTGRIGSFSLDNTTDFGDPIVARITTGYLNHDTNSMKLCRRVLVALRRGTSGSTPGPVGWLRWRDRPGAWEGNIPLDFGPSGDREIVLPFPSLGTYRSRQWQFEFGESGQIALVSVIEDYDVLGI